MEKDPREVAAEFAAMMLGGSISEGPAPEGSVLADLEMLMPARRAGLLTLEQLRSILHRLHPEVYAYAAESPKDSA